MDDKRRKPLNIYPGLAARMAYHYHGPHELAEIMGVSYGSALRRLSGSVDFELSEIKKLMEAYDATFETLFGETRT